MLSKSLLRFVALSFVLAACGTDASTDQPDDVVAVDASTDTSALDASDSDSGTTDVTIEDSSSPDVNPDTSDVSEDADNDGADDVDADVPPADVNDAALDGETDAADADSPDASDADDEDAADAADEDTPDAVADVLDCDSVECEVGQYCESGECLEGCLDSDNCALGDECVEGTCVTPSCSCEDGDGDGSYATDCEDPLCVPRTDCNDGRNDIFVGAEEICGNDVDEDCSGEDLECPLPFCPSGTGLYCGGNGVDGADDILFFCDQETETAFFRAVCVEGCMANEPGINDACNPGVCPFGNGRYCGPIVGQPDNMLLNCVNGAYNFQEACENICVVADPGFNDFCE